VVDEMPRYGELKQVIYKYLGHAHIFTFGRNMNTESNKNTYILI
jgi:hypothetical protein